MTVPDRSLAQRRAALERANVIRMSRARFKRELAGEERFDLAVSLIADRELPAGYELEHFHTMPVSEVLRAIRGVGAVKVAKLLQVARTSPSKTLGGMTDRQRKTVAMLLTPGALGEFYPGTVFPRAIERWDRDRRVA